MTEGRDGRNRGPRRPPGRGRGERSPAPGPRPGKPGQRPAPKRRGGLGLTRVGGNDFDLAHPQCVRAMELDYEEGIELWKAGDPESARDALRYALQGCGDNLWVHVALGRIALQDFHDPSLARGHFGYAFELAQRAVPSGFTGRLPRHRPANRPFFDAIDGLAACYDALGNPGEAARLRALAARLAGELGPRPGGASVTNPLPQEP
jgi:hypothetical protein